MSDINGSPAPGKRVKPKPTLNFNAIAGSTSQQLGRGTSTTSSDAEFVHNKRDSLLATVASVNAGFMDDSDGNLANRLQNLGINTTKSTLNSVNGSTGVSTTASRVTTTAAPSGLRTERSLTRSDSADSLGGDDSNRVKKEKYDIKPENLGFLFELGAGNGGSVAKMRYLPNGMIMARKTIPIPATSEPDRNTLRARISRELKILNRCSSPYIVSFYGAYVVEDPKSVNVVMEYMDLGSLDSIYRKTGPFEEPMVGMVANAMLEGLLYLYETFKIMHRDIKPSNVLISTTGSIKLADFGVSGEADGRSMANTFVGTGVYMSPERILGRPYTVRSDIWSLGLTVLEVLVGRFPVNLSPTAPVFEQIQFVVNEFKPDIEIERLPGVAFDLKEFLILTLKKDEKDRAGLKELLDHRFIKRIKAMNYDVEAWAQRARRLMD